MARGDGRDIDTNAKWRSLALLLVAEVAAMSLWFATAAILPAMAREGGIGDGAQAALSSAVQGGFVVGALAFAWFGLPDRYDPRRVLAISAVLAGVANAGLLVVTPGGGTAIILRAVTGALLAGVYPVGMKIAIGWGTRDRGFLVGALIGALTIGSAAPHLVALVDATSWRLTVAATSIAAFAAGAAALGVALGPHHARAASFDPRALTAAWTNRRIRLAYLGYLGHMWELYAMWAWIAAASAASYGATLSATAAGRLGTLTAFLAMAAGGVISVVAGYFADRIGKADVAIWAMAVSGLAALATAWSFGGPPALTMALAIVWGAAIVPDSAQFSALVADAAPADLTGSMLTLQTALGFALTTATVQATPLVATALGWPATFAILAAGPAVGVIAMLRLRGITAPTAPGPV